MGKIDELDAARAVLGSLVSSSDPNGLRALEVVFGEIDARDDVTPRLREVRDLRNDIRRQLHQLPEDHPDRSGMGLALNHLRERVWALESKR